MKAIILAAGKGKRFGEKTKNLPKPLLKLGKFTLIEHNIFLLKKYGFNDIVINVSYLSQTIIDYLGDGSKYGISIKYSIEKPEPLETGGGIHNALPLLGDDIFLVINSDIYTDCILSDIVLAKNDLASLIMVKNPDHNPNGDFSLSNKRIKFNQDNKLTYSGIGIYNPKIFKNVELSNYMLINLLLPAIKSNKVSGQLYNGVWFDIGDNKKLKKAENYFSKMDLHD